MVIGTTRDIKAGPALYLNRSGADRQRVLRYMGVQKSSQKKLCTFELHANLPVYARAGDTIHFWHLLPSAQHFTGAFYDEDANATLKESQKHQQWKGESLHCRFKSYSWKIGCEEVRKDANCENIHPI